MDVVARKPAVKNPIAHDLRTPKYRERTQGPPRKHLIRKLREAETLDDLDDLDMEIEE